MSDYFWGVTCGLLGSIAINTGNNLQSLGMKQLQEKVAAKRAEEAAASAGAGGGGGGEATAATTPGLKGGAALEELVKEIDESELDMTQSKTWILGTCIFLTGSAFNFGSYGLAAQSVLASLEASQFVTNILFSKFLLKVKILPRMIVGTALICLGTVLIVAFGNDKNDLLSFEDLADKYQNPIFLAYLCFIVIAAVILHHIHKHYQKMKDAGTPLPHSELVLPITYAVFSAFFGTSFVVQCKVFMKLLQYAADASKNLLLQPFFYTTIVTALPLVAVWLFRLNEALSLYEPLFIIPLIQSNFIIWAIISGGIFFEEFICFDGGMWSGFLGGLAIVLAGLYQMRPELNDSKIVPEDELQGSGVAPSPAPPMSPLPAGLSPMPASVPMEDGIPTEMMGEPLSKADAKAIADKLKEDIKAWEVEFRQREGREPNNEDKEAIRSKCDAFGRYKLAYERAEDPTGVAMPSNDHSMPPMETIGAVGGLNIAKQLSATMSKTTHSLLELTTGGGGGDDDKTEQSTHEATTESIPGRKLEF